MNISSNGKIEAAAAIGSVGAGIAGAIFFEPILLVAGAVAAIVATTLQLRDARLRREIDVKLGELNHHEHVGSGHRY
jgi:hypothetical protein